MYHMDRTTILSNLIYFEARKLHDFRHLLSSMKYRNAEKLNITCFERKYANLHGFALAKRKRYQIKAKPSNAIPITISHLERKAKDIDELN